MCSPYLSLLSWFQNTSEEEGSAECTEYLAVPETRQYSEWKEHVKGTWPSVWIDGSLNQVLS